MDTTGDQPREPTRAAHEVLNTSMNIMNIDKYSMAASKSRSMGYRQSPKMTEKAREIGVKNISPCLLTLQLSACELLLLLFFCFVFVCLFVCLFVLFVCFVLFLYNCSSNQRVPCHSLTVLLPCLLFLLVRTQHSPPPSPTSSSLCSFPTTTKSCAKLKVAASFVSALTFYTTPGCTSQRLS